MDPIKIKFISSFLNFCVFFRFRTGSRSCAHCAPFNCSGSRFLSLVSHVFICFYLSLSFVFSSRHYDYIAPHWNWWWIISFVHKLAVNRKVISSLVWLVDRFKGKFLFVCVVRKWNRHSGLVGEEKGVVAFFFSPAVGGVTRSWVNLTRVWEKPAHTFTATPRKKSCVRRPFILFIYFYFFFRIFPTYVFRVFGATAEGKQNVGHKQTNVSVRSCKEGRDRMERWIFLCCVPAKSGLLPVHFYKTHTHTTM